MDDLTQKAVAEMAAIPADLSPGDKVAAIDLQLRELEYSKYSLSLQVRIGALVGSPTDPAMQALERVLRAQDILTELKRVLLGANGASTPDGGHP